MEDMNIEVLGTEFDVINYAEFATTEAILCNGSIRAYGGRLPAPVTLKPGDRLVFDRKEGRASRSRVSTRNYSQWMGGLAVVRRHLAGPTFSPTSNAGTPSRSTLPRRGPGRCACRSS